MSAEKHLVTNSFIVANLWASQDPRTLLKSLLTFLPYMNVDVLAAASTATKAQSTVSKVRDIADPLYITQLLLGIFHGTDADVKRLAADKRQQMYVMFCVKSCESSQHLFWILR